MGKTLKGCLYNYTCGKEVTRNPLKTNFTGIWLDLKIDE